MESKKESVFDVLNKIECKVDKKAGFNYISWTDAWKQTKKLYPNATFKIYENKTIISKGNIKKETTSFVFVDNYGAFVKVGVTIEDIEYIEVFPVLNGANMPIKKESYEYTNKWNKKFQVEALSSFNINKSIKRALVKALAFHGLGLYVFEGEDLPDVEEDKK